MEHVLSPDVAEVPCILLLELIELDSIPAVGLELEILADCDFARSKI